MGRRYRIIILSGLAVLLLDQLTKIWVQRSIPVWEKGLTFPPRSEHTYIRLIL